MDSSTMPATSPTTCWACQLAGNSFLREAVAMSHSAGATATATSESSGDRMIMMTSEKMNRMTLPRISGIHAAGPAPC